VTYSLEVRPDAPIMLFIQGPTDRLIEEMAESQAETIRLLDQQTEQVFLVMDIQSASMDLGDRLKAASMSARGERSMLHHPMLRETVFVSTEPMVKQSLRAMSSATFGMARVTHVETLDEALDYCFKKIGQPKRD
jgi:cytochrome P450